jgi:hypothetical protein
VVAEELSVVIDGAIGIYHIGLVEELPKPWQPAPAHIRVRVDSESTIGVFVARELLASVERDGARDRCNFGSCCQLALDVLSGLQPLEEIACFAQLALRRPHSAAQIRPTMEFRLIRVLLQCFVIYGRCNSIELERKPIHPSKAQMQLGKRNSISMVFRCAGRNARKLSRRHDGKWTS